jgi:hypothetical protein
VNGCPYYHYSISKLINETIPHNSFKILPIVPESNNIDDAEGDAINEIIVIETTPSFLPWESPL